ncbi:unnamed protein product [Brassica oleracea var. botrytis]
MSSQDPKPKKIDQLWPEIMFTFSLNFNENFPFILNLTGKKNSFGSHPFCKRHIMLCIGR